MSEKIKRSQVGRRKFRVRVQRSLAPINRHLSKQIDIQRVINDYPVLEVKDGIAKNINYTNPQHLKWLDD